MADYHGHTAAAADTLEIQVGQVVEVEGAAAAAVNVDTLDYRLADSPRT